MKQEKVAVPVSAPDARHCATAPRPGSRTYVESLGFHVRGGNVSQAVLDHLNDNRRHYSQAVRANADELTLSRILANYSYTPAGSNAAPVLLGTLLDPKPIAATGNYLGFRLNTMSQALTKGIEAAAGNDKAAGERAQEALKTATEHLQKMTQIAADAMTTPIDGNLSALDGLLNQGGKKAGADTKPDAPSTGGSAAKA
ncbi:hypothetical protein ACGFZP_23905 [Kitasatospora sp. NPDC048239]|uniref:hypothetical protein n=1 Tax=Kitasatospora sp. NPDC048239 TaxID=3364046 RepID=UPI00371A2199